LPFLALAQPSNDACLNALLLTDVSNYCSPPGAFSTVGATTFGSPDPFCFPGLSGDVWFRFVAQATDVAITLIGNTPANPGGTLEDPQFAIYAGNCGNLTEIQCASDGFNENIAETFAGPLVVGETYYIQVDARNGNTGTFQLCVNNYNLIPDPSSDCPTGVVLCDKSPFTVESLEGSGLLVDEVDPFSCLQEEFASAWYKWTCKDPGTLTFTLTPNNPSDDLDFAVYELPDFDDCSNKILLRCMASGENVGQPFNTWQPCTGPTGLNLASSDIVEFPGCDPGDDNFIAAINMEAGKSYALLVNNFSNTGNGFGITWGGTGTFLGPEADMLVEPELENQCDIDVITFTDNSEIPPGFTASYSWYFGAGANPSTASGPGPHQIVYNSFGSKSIVLQIDTEQGCIVTEVRQIFIEPCCDPATNLGLAVDDVMDPLCYEEPSGSILVAGTAGTPGYLYSIDGENFQPIGEFINLYAGNYTLYVQDIKGCIDSLETTLINPPELIVDAGPDVTIELGETTDLDATYLPSSTILSLLQWNNTGTLTCPDCLDPTASPYVTTTYTITIADPFNCLAADSVTVFVNPVRPVYIPNIFTPNYDGINDNFTAYGGPAAVQIESMKIFNRWGSLMWEGYGLPLGDDSRGWDGTFNGKALNSGVYVYLIEVSFLDGVIFTYSGDINLVR
jgi:gliding motility-associated-like protein